MALTEITSKGIKDADIATADIADDAITQAKIADESVNEARIQISNAGTNGQYLQKQSGNTGGLTWADVPAGVGGATGVDFNDDVKARFGTGNDLEIQHTSGHSRITQSGAGNLIVEVTTTDSDLILRAEDKVSIQPHNGNEGVVCNAQGSTDLYYNNVKKVETSTGGAKIPASGADAIRELRIDGTNGSSEIQGFILENDGGNGRVNLKYGTGGGTPSTKVSMLASGGLTFNGDTAAANALDDYEEGTFTVAMNFHGSGSSGSISLYSDQDLLSYTKIGRVVYITGRVRIETKSGGAGTDTSIGNLPFAAASATEEENAGALHCYTYGTNLGDDNYNNPWLSVDPGGNKGYFYVTRNDDSWTPIAPSQWANGDYILVSGHYFV